MYNEMAYLVLGEVTAAAQAVANTVKRVVILLATVAFLGESMDAQGPKARPSPSARR